MYELKDFNTLYQEEGQKHILLGNGFSLSLLQAVGVDKPAFSYQAIVEQIINEHKSKTTHFNGDIALARQIADTYNLETIIEELNNLGRFSPVYQIPAQDIQKDVETLKECLPRIIGEHHPSSLDDFYGNKVSVDICKSGAAFIRKFQNVFTLNYDLFLYWIINKMDMEKEYFDGFGTDRGNGELIWRNTCSEEEHKKIHYLHGGLHYYQLRALKNFTDIVNYGLAIEKIQNDGTSNIMSQIKEKIENNLLPFVVVEGNSEEKLERIADTDVLANSFKHLMKLKGSIFFFGANFESDEDNHILQAIGHSNEIVSINYGIYNPIEEDVAYLCHDLTCKIQNYLKPDIKVMINFYDSSKVNIWKDFTPDPVADLEL